MNEEKVQVAMTAEELAQWQALKEKQEKAERERKAKDDREAYRSLAASTVDEVFPRHQDGGCGAGCSRTAQP